MRYDHYRTLSHYAHLMRKDVVIKIHLSSLQVHKSASNEYSIEQATKSLINYLSRAYPQFFMLIDMYNPTK